MKQLDLRGKKDSQEIAWIIRDKYGGHADPELLTKDIQRLKTGEPLAYLIGSVPFLNCEIGLSYKPLIPRAETEYWVEQAIKKISIFCSYKQKVLKPVKCLDVFAGSGCLGIAILKNVPNSKVVFTEKDKKLLTQIETNLKLNKIPPSRYQIIQSDILSNVTKRFDYVLANPPYIPVRRKLPAGVMKWEPKQALRGGVDGLLFIRKFLKQAKNYLKPGGQIWLEFDSGQKPAIEKLITDFGYQNNQFYRDQYKRWRFVTLQNIV